MPACPHCQTPIEEGARFCPACGQPAGVPSEDVTRTEVAAEPSSKTEHPTEAASTDERFVPGAVIGGRYRVATLLGQGGMGDVYRATDLRLGQTVALKFLPRALSSDTRTLERFRNEVRVARNVTHPNVCRVHDLGEVDGHAFLTMEFVDGEDLASLLRRIGRLPADKATELARQLCAGLAAAHEQGVLHRDLKPANLMVDGRGQLRIMDFGLAAVSGAVQQGDIRSGTLAYMAPEQIEGREVTARSDIYALGLVLYEMFTGRRPFVAQTVAELRDKQDSSRPESMTSQVADLDPAVERVILRCLEPDPANRAASVLAVAAALPGGDPLAAALAAGETPSPELVAAAGSQGALAPRWVALWLVVIVAGLGLMAKIGDVSNFLTVARPRWSPEVLAARSAELVRRLGFPDPADTYYSLQLDGDFIRQQRESGDPTGRLARSQERPGAVRFFYRESPEPLVNPSIRDSGEIRPFAPPLTRSGMVTVLTDLDGRLLWLEATPPQKDATPPDTATFDWQPLFAAAGLDPSRFHNMEPEWQPLAAPDVRLAWEGSFEGKPNVAIRVETGAWRGRATHFYVIGPWTRADRMAARERSEREELFGTINLALLAVIIASVLVFARHNTRHGRGDRRGAFVMGLYIFATFLLAEAFGAHHVAAIGETTVLGMSLAYASMFAVTTWVAYLALEPPVRRRWPSTLIAWSRLLAGRWQDPLVGHHVLVGLAAGVVLVLVADVPAIFPETRAMGGNGFNAFLGPRQTLSYLMATLSLGSVFNAMLNFFLLFLFRLVFRRDWLTAVVFVLVFSVLNSISAPNPWLQAGSLILANSIWVLVTLRYGLLAMTATHFVLSLSNHFHFTTALGAWYGGPAIIVNLAVVGLAIWAARVALGGRRLIEATALD
ncbi:MAG: serine/threonine-protein kinase [Bryobacteraceae bacterium]